MQQVMIAIASIVLLSLSNGVLAETDDAKFQAAWEAANTARLQAAELEHEWRDTEKMLEKAKVLAADGNYAQALQLVAYAHMEGERAIEQAQQQAQLWQDAVPR